MYMNRFENVLSCCQKNFVSGVLNFKHTTLKCKSTNSNGLFTRHSNSPLMLSALKCTYLLFIQSKLSPNIIDLILL